MCWVVLYVNVRVMWRQRVWPYDRWGIGTRSPFVRMDTSGKDLMGHRGWMRHGGIHLLTDLDYIAFAPEEAAGERARRHRASKGFTPSKEDLYVM